MHPLADVAQQDLSNELSAPRSGSARSKLSQLIARVLRAWMTGWTWYARQGLAPASVEPVFPARALPRPRRAAPTRLIRHLALAPPVLSVADLYECATPAGCP